MRYREILEANPDIIDDFIKKLNKKNDLIAPAVMGNPLSSRLDTKGETPKDNDGLKAGPPYPKEDMENVKAMQRKLEQLGYPVGNTGVDGKYGPRTTRAVRAYKKDNNISTSASSLTSSEFAKLLTAKPVANPTTVQSPTKQRTTVSKPLSQDSVTQGKVGQVLDLIAKPESGGRYDAVYPGRRKPEILDMTISELMNDMRIRGRKTGSSASGRYQYIRKTLGYVIKSMGINPKTTKFDKKTQDEIVIHHLRQDHGLDSWLSGKMSNEQFLNKLSRTWAGIPKSSGGSFYAGVLDNKAGMAADDALASLQSIREPSSSIV